MKFVFVSNYLNHHQIPFCSAMYDLLAGDFAFIQTEPMEEERIRMGWSQNEKAQYLKLYYREEKMCRRLIEESGVALFGGTDEESYIRGRLESGKPVIRYSERLYKTGQWRAVSPRGLFRKYQDHTRYRKKPVYMLCSGAYVPSDFHIVGAYPGKLLRWGYFPETKAYDVDRLMREKTPGSILWAARFIDWKHPELALKAARYLMLRGVSFHMDMVGGGEMEPFIRRMLSEYGLENQVSLLGYQSPEKIRRLMEKSEIYLMTSDRKEGWGAVVNEAMNSGCALVADHMVGAVPFLVKHGINGLIYRDGCKDELFAQTERLLEDRRLRERMGRKAVETIVQEWNAGNAAKRLLELCVRLGFFTAAELEASAGKVSLEFEREPSAGPCSPAPVIPERKMYKRLKGDQN